MSFLDLTQLTAQKVTEIRHPVTNQLVMVIHTKGGVVHRDGNLPAAIHYDGYGEVWAHEWYVNGVAHRDDGPAKMYLQHPQPKGAEAIANGGKHIAEWYFKGEYTQQGILDHQTFHQHFKKGS